MKIIMYCSIKLLTAIKWSYMSWFKDLYTYLFHHLNPIISSRILPRTKRTFTKFGSKHYCFAPFSTSHPKQRQFYLDGYRRTRWIFYHYTWANIRYWKVWCVDVRGRRFYVQLKRGIHLPKKKEICSTQSRSRGRLNVNYVFFGWVCCINILPNCRKKSWQR